MILEEFIMPKFLKRTNRELLYEADEDVPDYSLIFTKPDGTEGVIENLTAEEIINVSKELREEGCKNLQVIDY